MHPLNPPRAQRPGSPLLPTALRPPTPGPLRPPLPAPPATAGAPATQPPNERTPHPAAVFPKHSPCTRHAQEEFCRPLALFPMPHTTATKAACLPPSLFPLSRGTCRPPPTHPSIHPPHPLCPFVPHRACGSSSHRPALVTLFSTLPSLLLPSPFALIARLPRPPVGTHPHCPAARTALHIAAPPTHTPPHTSPPHASPNHPPRF